MKDQLSMKDQSQIDETKQAKMIILCALPEPVDPTQRMQQWSHCGDLAWLTVRKGDLSDTARPAILTEQSQLVLTSWKYKAETESY